jgi:rSAM/selenodomain-associated transferase 1
MKEAPAHGRLLIVFAKNPTMASVKTRLGAALGPERAIEIHNLLHSRVQRAAAPLLCDIEVHYFPEVQEKDLWSCTRAKKKKQHGADLGERMQYAIQSGLDAGYAKVCIIGTDVPDVSTDILRDAFAALDTNDVVFGPAYDGGYYLIGMIRMVAKLFSGIPWSTTSVLHQSIKTLSELHIAYATVATLTDVDTLEDLKKTGLWPPPGRS